MEERKRKKENKERNARKWTEKDKIKDWIKERTKTSEWWIIEIYSGRKRRENC